MEKESNFFNKHINIKRSGTDPKRLKSHVVKRANQENKLAKRVNTIRQASDLSFGQIQDEILNFLHKNHAFDAGMMQRWVEKRAQKLERKEKHLGNKVLSLFGRGRKVNESSCQLKLLAEQIEGKRQGVDPMVIKRFLGLADEVIRANLEDLTKLLEWVQSHQEKYGKEILDLIELLEPIEHPKIQSFNTKLKGLIDQKKVALLDDLFAGKSIQIKILAEVGG